MSIQDAEARQNVLYITVDSLRADRVGYVDDSRETTPILDALGEQGTVIDRGVANGVPTYYSFKSLLGGIHPLSHSRDIGLPNTATSIAEVFDKAGYETAGFNARNPWLTPSYGYERGFQTFEDFMGGGSSKFALGRATREAKKVAKRAVGFSDFLTDRLGRYGRILNTFLGSQPLAPAETVTEAAINWLQGVTNRPVFLWVHFMDPHYPWVPPRRLLKDDFHATLSRTDIGTIWHTVAYEYQSEETTIGEEMLTQIEQLYDAEVRRTDEAIGQLVDAFKVDERWEDTLLAVASDHGTELRDHGGFSHGPRRLYDEVLRVPLVFTGPTIATQTQDLGGLVDVPMTIVEAVDGLNPPDAFEGINLLEDTRTDVCSEVVYDIDPVRNSGEENGVLQAMTVPPWKFIYNRHTDTSELYNIEDDPVEQSPITTKTDVEEDLEATLDQHRDTIERRNRTIAEKSRVRRRVRALFETERV